MFGSRDSLVGFIVFTYFLLFWNPTPIRADDEPHPGSEGVEEIIQFDYRPDNPRGPQHWGNLKPEWSLCKDGKRQSPIALWEHNATKEITTDNDLMVNYKPANATIKDEEHAIEVLWEGDAGSIEINGTQYFLKQCHWHHPSEHVVNGERFELELHMVHKTEDQKKIAVIGFLYRFGHPNFFLAKINEHITTLGEVLKGIPLGVVDPRRVKRGQFEKKLEMPSANPPTKAGSKFYRYTGSLTTPPCAEEVIWHINKKVQTVAPEQVKRLQSAVYEYARNNARPLQPLNGRGYKLYGDWH